MARLIVSLTLLLSLLPLGAAERRVPTVDDLLNMKSIGGPQISPDGTRIVYTQTEADFKQDAFVTQLWMADVKSGETTQLTRGEKSSNEPQWSARRQVDRVHVGTRRRRNQLFVIDPRGGEAIQITKSENGDQQLHLGARWKDRSLTAPPKPLTPEQKDRKERLGDYEVVRREYQHVHLWTVGRGRGDEDAGGRQTADPRQGLQRRAVLVGAGRARR